MKEYNVLTEITSWEYPSHTYVLTNRNTRCVAYYKNNGNKITKFRKKLPFSTSRRKFITNKALEAQWN